jgi:hypothetical protein
MLKATIPLRTGRGLNGREHHMARARRVKAERQTTAWALVGKTAPPPPCTVLLTRVGPTNGLDDDNLAGSLKGVRDQVAVWLGVDDHDPRVQWRYAQRRDNAGWTVLVEVAC